MTNKSGKTFDFIQGEVLFFDKPLNWTSFDLVRKVRAILKRNLNIKKIKVGHAGTLDPKATGLLILCTGKKTKEIVKYQEYKKQYIADIYIGATTPSYDTETIIDKKYPIQHITKSQIKEVIKSFIGEQEQIPPAFSAKRVNGKRAYKDARKGIDVQIEPSLIHIYDIDIIKFDLPIIQIKVDCSKGTYIRALARDIGTALNSGAYLKELRRTKIGVHNVENCISLSDFKLMTPEKEITD